MAEMTKFGAKKLRINESSQRSSIRFFDDLSYGRNGPAPHCRSNMAQYKATFTAERNATQDNARRRAAWHPM